MMNNMQNNPILNNDQSHMMTKMQNNPLLNSN